MGMETNGVEKIIGIIDGDIVMAINVNEKIDSKRYRNFNNKIGIATIISRNEIDPRDSIIEVNTICTCGSSYDTKPYFYAYELSKIARL
jgi:hypothetical protein